MEKDYVDEMDKFRRLVTSTEQNAMECLSLLKFSEGLVRRDIDLVRKEIDLHLKKIVKQTLAELQKVYLSEKENIEEVLTNLKFISERLYDYFCLLDFFLHKNVMPKYSLE